MKFFLIIFTLTSAASTNRRIASRKGSLRFLTSGLDKNLRRFGENPWKIFILGSQRRFWKTKKWDWRDFRKYDFLKTPVILETYEKGARRDKFETSRDKRNFTRH